MIAKHGPRPTCAMLAAEGITLSLGTANRIRIWYESEKRAGRIAPDTSPAQPRVAASPDPEILAASSREDFITAIQRQAAAMLSDQNATIPQKTAVLNLLDRMTERAERGRENGGGRKHRVITVILPPKEAAP